MFISIKDKILIRKVNSTTGYSILINYHLPKILMKIHGFMIKKNPGA